MNNDWLMKNTFHYSDFMDLSRLVDVKKQKNLSISLCLPTLNEEKTIAKEIIIMKSELMTLYPLLDEIVVIDSGSTDKTLEVAKAFGADVYEADQILPELEKFKGKGENLWKALYVAKGDIIVYLDADIKNIHHRFAYGLIGPLLMTENIKYSKAFYDRPIAIGKNKIRPTGGGRVTELVIRPLFSLFFPELTQIIQPLSGEYAGFRELFEKIPFPIGYGIETSMILDICEKWGLDVIGQVDLERRVHRNQDTKALGKMNEMIQYNLVKNEFKPDIFNVDGLERPPIIEIPEYRKKFNVRS
jgi:glucosyl-3-phosphoglycerate synthase